MLPKPRRFPIAFKIVTTMVSRKLIAAMRAGATNETKVRRALRMKTPILINALITGPKNPPVSMVGEGGEMVFGGVGM